MQPASMGYVLAGHAILAGRDVLGPTDQRLSSAFGTRKVTQPRDELRKITFGLKTG